MPFGWEAVRGDGPPAEPTYWRTRLACIAYLRSRLLGLIAEGHRVLISFDFAYGYPTGFAAALGLPGKGPAWRLIWNELHRLIQDGPENKNNRFDVAAELNSRCMQSAPGPLWGRPANEVLAALSTHSLLFRSRRDQEFRLGASA